jgi:hypothetical protein
MVRRVPRQSESELSADSRHPHSEFASSSCGMGTMISQNATHLRSRLALLTAVLTLASAAAGSDLVTVSQDATTSTLSTASSLFDSNYVHDVPSTRRKPPATTPRHRPRRSRRGVRPGSRQRQRRPLTTRGVLGLRQPNSSTTVASPQTSSSNGSKFSRPQTSSVRARFDRTPTTSRATSGRARFTRRSGSWVLSTGWARPPSRRDLLSVLTQYPEHMSHDRDRNEPASPRRRA